MSNSLQSHGSYSPWNSPGQNTGVGSLCVLQGIFPAQESNSGLPHCRRILYQLSHQGSPSILEWVPYPFSRGSSLPRNLTGVSCIAGEFFVLPSLNSCPRTSPLVISKPCHLSSPHLTSPSSTVCDSFHLLLPHKQRIRVLFINFCLEEVRVIFYYPVEEVQA